MKKLLTILLFFVVLSMALLPVLAASGSMQLSASSTTLNRGNTFTLTVSLSGGNEVSNGGLVLSYDSSALELVSGSCDISGATGQVSASNNGGVFAMPSDTKVSGKIFTITMRVKSEAAFGSYTISGSANLAGGGSAISCSVSGTTVKVVCNHSYGDASKVNDSTHKQVCSTCGDEKSSNHSWDSGEVTKKASCTETGTRKHKCTATGCNATKTSTIDKTAHKNTCVSDGSTYHLLTCSVCGNQSRAQHSYGGWRHDANNHYHLCTGCGHKADQAEHTPGPEATEETDQVCTVCSRVLKPKGAHVHVFFPDWESDDVNHWHNCNDCDERDSEEAHVFTDDCDADCNTCGFTRVPAHAPATEWIADKDNHWRQCTNCGINLEKEAHTPGPEATITSAQSCTLCGYELAPMIPHEHSYAPDDNTHRHLCQCGDIYEASAEECELCTYIPWKYICIAEAALFALILLIVCLVKKKKKVLEETF